MIKRVIKKIFHKIKRKKSKGFTLIELLTVVTLLGILATIILVNLDSGRAKSRNNTRNHAIKQLVVAFNLGMNDNSTLPGGSISTWSCISLTCYGFLAPYAANPAVDAYITPYTKKPVDPTDNTRPGGGYIFVNKYGPVTDYKGTEYPIGNYLIWFTEPPLIVSSCGAGVVIVYTDILVLCVYKLD